MGWEDFKNYGDRNLSNPKKREAALRIAEHDLVRTGMDPECAREMVEHERQHMSAFPDCRQGQSVELALQTFGDGPSCIARLVVRVDGFTEEQVEASLQAVDKPSKGDDKLKRLLGL